MMVEKILRSAASDLQMLKTALSAGCCESLISEMRGYIKGKLQAARIITGKEYTWDSDGIYENHGNEPIIKA